MLIYELEDRDSFNPRKSFLEPATSASLEKHLKYIFCLQLFLIRVSGSWTRLWTKWSTTQTDSTSSKKSPAKTSSSDKPGWPSAVKKTSSEGPMARKSFLSTRFFLSSVFFLQTLFFQVNSVHKLPEAPSRIEPMLRSVQMKEYTDAVSDFATKSLGKLFITDAFQKSS